LSIGARVLSINARWNVSAVKAYRRLLTYNGVSSKSCASGMMMYQKGVIIAVWE